MSAISCGTRWPKAAAVGSHCQHCKTWEPVDLAALIIKHTPLFSLWNTSHQNRPACGARLSFHAQPSKGRPVIVLGTSDPTQTDDLHR
jgi:hypothetical protein